MADVTIRNFYPHKFTLDPDDDSAPQIIDLRIARFTVEEGKAFNRDWARVMDPPSGRFIFRKTEGDEQIKTSTLRRGQPVETFLVDDDEVRRRRLQEMTPTDRATFLEQADADAAFEYDFLVTLITAHVSVAPGQCVKFEDDKSQMTDVRTGADLVRVFGGQRGQLVRFGTAIWAENNLGADQKKAWRSLFASPSSSSGPAKVLPGPKPADPARPVESADSAATAAVTDANEPIPSGSITR